MSKQQQTQVRGRTNKVMLFTCALILVAAVAAGIIINNATSGSRFENEIVAINDAFSKGDDTKINEVLDRTMSTGEYAKVEKSLKSYVGDLFKNINDIDELSDNDTIYNSLEGEYLAKNIDKLDSTVAELKDASAKIDVLTADAKKLYNEESVREYIKEQNLDENYTKLFIDNAKLFYDDEDLRDNYNNTLKLLSKSIKVEVEAVEYLNKNKSGWKIENKQLVFTDDAVAKKYNEILNKVAKI